MIMSKYQRSQPTVQRTSDESVSEDHWLKQFENNLQKGAVQPRSQQSLFEQINSIMNRQSKYPSVEAAVEDMKERSGLKAYLDQVKRADNEITQTTTGSRKTAADDNQVKSKKSRIPIVIQKYPPILNTFQNCIKDTKGNLPIPAIIERVRSIHQGDVSEAKDWDEDSLMYLVSQLNLEAKKANPSNFHDSNNLGARDDMADSDIDVSNTDAFHALNPSKI
jgi:hypothetical protein